jgi:hypothetical protein
MLEPRKPSFDLTELVGLPANEARERCEVDGFIVQIIDSDRTNAMTLDYNRNRIRLIVRHGNVFETQQS